MVTATVQDRIDILGVPVSVVDKMSALDTIAKWIAERRQGVASPRYVCACDVHSLMRAHDDPQHMRALRGAQMVVPDGTPLVWVSRLRGEKRIGRVPGPDLLSLICEHSEKEGWSHYFYGGAEGVAGKLAERLARHYPGINIAGTHCPPFRPLSADESRDDIARIDASGADIVWIGLGCPKQEQWMLDHERELQGRILIGVGAAFDFHTGRIERAPKWMRDNGLEWLHRLASEPKRLWRRYLLMAPRFVALSLAETCGQARRRMTGGFSGQH
ncbi:MAG: WecB/TagA/CpsF family glycosyltransferase [Hyphomicrobiaceae bacterium]